MELWIRSQDGESLIPVNKPIVVFDTSILYKESASYFITIGKYKTKERTIEVLNDIQNKLSYDMHLDGSYEWMDIQMKGMMVKGMMGYIYRMPKK